MSGLAAAALARSHGADEAAALDLFGERPRAPVPAPEPEPEPEPVPTPAPWWKRVQVE